MVSKDRRKWMRTTLLSFLRGGKEIGFPPSLGKANQLKSAETINPSSSFPHTVAWGGPLQTPNLSPFPPSSLHRQKCESFYLPTRPPFLVSLSYCKFRESSLFFFPPLSFPPPPLVLIDHKSPSARGYEASRIWFILYCRWVTSKGTFPLFPPPFFSNWRYGLRIGSHNSHFHLFPWT